jgi:hypothetical protein
MPSSCHNTLAFLAFSGFVLRILQAETELMHYSPTVALSKRNSGLLAWPVTYPQMRVHFIPNSEYQLNRGINGNS